MPHLQLKDVPVAIHDGLRLRAARAGISMREYVLRLIEADLGQQDTWAQMIADLSTSASVTGDAPSGSELVQRARAERATRA